jgi:hypothetical protein
MTFYSAIGSLPNAEISTTFDILEEGNNVRATPKTAPCLMDLPRYIHAEVVEYACSPETSVVFDLDKKVTLGLTCPLLFVGNTLRQYVQLFVTWNRTRIALKMTARSSTTDFDHFKALECWAGNHTLRCMFSAQHRSPKSIHDQKPIIVFNFDLEKSAPWNGVRINVKHLLHLVEEMYGNTKFEFRQHNLATSQAGLTKSCAPWKTLHMSVCLLLADMFLSEPSRGSQILPYLWIDGEGRLLHAAYQPTTGTDSVLRYDYKYAQFDDD